MFYNIKRNKKHMKNRLIAISTSLILLLCFLIIRLDIVMKDNTVNTNLNTNYVHKENISNSKYLLLYRNREEVFNYNKKYKLAIDVGTFELNTTAQNARYLIMFNIVMREEIEGFSFPEILKQVGNRVYYDISQDAYDKLKSILPNIRGVYAYEYNEVAKEEAWKIETMIQSPTSFRDNTKKASNSLEMAIQKEVNDNQYDKIVFEKDSAGNYGEGIFEDNKNNLNVKLTLDKELQDNIREILKDEKYEDFNNIGAVLIEASTGKILSLVQKDETQPNIVTGAGGIYGYTPGSVFKILTLEAAMKYNAVNLNDKRICEGKICKKDKIHGKISIKDAFKVSCNDIFAQLGEEVGKEKILELAKEQGVYQQVLGMDLETGMESTGRVADDAAITNIAIGQSMDTNLLQMTALITSIVNKGEYVKPYIVDSFENQNGETIKVGNSVKNKVISENIADSLKMVMNATVASGTAKRAMVPGIEVGAKTGTAQIMINGSNDAHGWFVGYFNYNNKYYALGVFVPNIGLELQGEEAAGGNTAGVVFKDIVSMVTKSN